MKDIAPLRLTWHGGSAQTRRQNGRNGRLTKTSGCDPWLHHAKPDLRGFDKVDVVIEAIVEDIAIKHKVLREIEESTSPSTILASNTSSLQIGALAEAYAASRKVFGHAFFNPVPKMPLVEVVRGPKHRQKLSPRSPAMRLAMGKTPIVVEDCRALSSTASSRLSHRVSAPRSRRANFVEIDKAMEASAGRWTRLSHRCHRHGYFAACRRDRLGGLRAAPWT